METQDKRNSKPSVSVLRAKEVQHSDSLTDLFLFDVQVHTFNTELNNIARSLKSTYEEYSLVIVQRVAQCRSVGSVTEANDYINIFMLVVILYFLRS